MDAEAQGEKHQGFNLALIFIPGLVILFIQYVWKMAYLGGSFPGLYWLFVGLDSVFIHLIVGSAILGVIFLVIQAAKAGFTVKNRRWLNYSLCMFVLAGSIFCTLPITFAQNTKHLQSLRVEQKVYQMGAYPMFDINFYVAECGPLGMICKTIFRSHDVMDPDWEKSRLIYDETKRELQLNDPGEGIIFTYPIR